MQRHLYEHFTLPGHSGFLHDVSITLIDKIAHENTRVWWGKLSPNCSSGDLLPYFFTKLEIIVFKYKLCHFQYLFRRNDFLVSFI